MIIPCIDLMDGKAVQLIRGRKKALEVENPLDMLKKFRGFPIIQVIDLDAAVMGSLVALRSRRNQRRLVPCIMPSLST